MTVSEMVNPSQNFFREVFTLIKDLKSKNCVTLAERGSPVKPGLTTWSYTMMCSSKLNEIENFSFPEGVRVQFFFQVDFSKKNTRLW